MKFKICKKHCRYPLDYAEVVEKFDIASLVITRSFTDQNVTNFTSTIKPTPLLNPTDSGTKGKLL